MSPALVPPTQPVLELVAPGLLATVQDSGRPGWRRLGVPVSGAMDDWAAAAANQLVGNPPDAPVLELLLQGARLRALREVTLALTGADANANVPMWRPVTLAGGDQLALPRNRSGVWTYLAVAGGLAGDPVLNSVSAYPRGGIGRVLAAHDVLSRVVPSERVAAAAIQARDYGSPPALRVWPGPQWEALPEPARAAFIAQPWTVSSQSDRIGYRLTGEPLAVARMELLSEPMLPGTIQVPASGLPIVMMRDGPTVGGYPKLGCVDPADLSWLAQCRPGQSVRFRLLP